MRIQHWLQAIVCGMLFLTASTAHAQYPLPTDGPYSRPPGVGMMPYGGGDVTQMWPPNTPQGYYPYPAISPYGPSGGTSGGALGIDQTYNRDGIWFRQFLNQHRDYHFSIEATKTNFRNPGAALIGAPYAEFAPWNLGVLGVPFSVRELELALPSPVPNFTPNPIGQFWVDHRIFPFPLVGPSVPSPIIAEGQLFPIRTMDLFDSMTTAGIQTSWGFENQDGTGLNWNSVWNFKRELEFTSGREFINGIRVDEALTLILGGQNLFTKNGGIPLENGEPTFVDFGTGSVARYDILYNLQFSTQMGGTNLSWYHTPVVRNDWMQVRTLWGARYTFIGERFAFRGIDSGFDYTVLYDGDDEAFYRPDPTTLIQLYPQYEANLESTADSHIFGPEIGFRFDLGEGDNFHVWGESIAGLAFNNETLRVRGRNISDPLYDAQILGLAIPLGQLPRIFTNNSEFDDRDNHTHVSPILSQSINADMELFEYVPGLNKLQLLEDAKFRMGYQFFLAGHVARPADSIVWNGFPLLPEVNAKYKNWYMHQFNFGINWEY